MESSILLITVISLIGLMTLEVLNKKPRYDFDCERCGEGWQSSEDKSICNPCKQEVKKRTYDKNL